MRKINAENERIKRRYCIFLKESDGQSEQSLDKVRAALLKFEESTNFKPFKKFHIDQAVKFKAGLARVKNPQTGKPLSLSTVDGTLRLNKAFFKWLAAQQGFKRVLSYTDARYFNNNRNDARAAHAQRPKRVPSQQSALHAFQAMPERTDIQKRDKAIFAFVALTGARVSAVATFKCKHINLIDGTVFQDGREVKTKFKKTFTTTFFPVDPAYLKYFTGWVNYLRNVLLFGPEDALFPRPEPELVNGKFTYDKLSRNCYGSSEKINQVVKQAFRDVQQPAYNAHSFRDMLVRMMVDLKLTGEEEKAWSLNLGHDSTITTYSSYLQISEERQSELIKKLG